MAKSMRNTVLVMMLAVFVLMGCMLEGDSQQHQSDALLAVDQMLTAEDQVRTAMRQELDASGIAASSAFFRMDTGRSLFSGEDIDPDQEDDFWESLSEEMQQILMELLDEYALQLEELGRVQIFTGEVPEGIVETDESVFFGNYEISKQTPEGLARAYAMAQAVLGEEPESRGAWIIPITVRVPFFFWDTIGWRRGNIPYVFDGFPVQHRSDIQAKMAEWENASEGLVTFQEKRRFTWWTRRLYNLGFYRVVRITQEVMSNAIGKATPGEMSRAYMKLHPIIWTNQTPDGVRAKKRTIRHELGHVLGLQHEFERRDRDDHILPRPGRDIPGIGPAGRFFVSHSPEYDYNSVMNYSGFYHKKNPDGTRGPLITLDDVYRISDGDAKTIQYLYGGMPRNFDW